jgi:hypothetical protein
MEFHMGLYPTTILDAVTAASGYNCIYAGTLVAIPIDMAATQMSEITLAQMSHTQDYSLRAWLSEYVGGVAIPPGFIPVLKTASVPIVIYTASQTPPANTIGIPVVSDCYILNILNLTNENNVFAFSKTDKDSPSIPGVAGIMGIGQLAIA